MFRFKVISDNLKDEFWCSHDIEKTPYDNRTQYSKHFHENFELLLFLEGDVSYNIDGNIYNLKPYDLLLIPPYTYHFLIPKSNVCYESYVINIGTDSLSSKQKEKLFSPPHILNIANDSDLRRMFTLLDYYYEAFSDTDFHQATLHTLYTVLLMLFYKKDEKEPPDESTEEITLISKITTYINENITGELNAERIATHFNFSRSYIQNLFSSVMNIGLKQYINRKKIYAARADIQKGMLPNDVMKKYSFKDYSSFYRLYKTVFEVSPRDDFKLKK